MLSRERKGRDSISSCRIELYYTSGGAAPIEAYIKKLAKKHKDKDIAAILSYKRRLEEYGLEVNTYHHDTIKLLRDGIYELRPSGTRIFFFFYVENTIVLLHAFEKKRWTVPPDEITKAMQERDDFLRRKYHGKR